MAVTTIGTGETYTTIQSWEDNVLSKVLTEQETGECKAEIFSFAVFSGTTTTSNYYIKLTSQLLAEHDGRANQVSGKGNARIFINGDVTIIRVYDEYFEFSWMEIIGPGNYARYGFLMSNVVSCWCRVHHNISHNNHASNSIDNHGMLADDDDCIFRFYRNISYGYGSCGIVANAGAANSALYNNTLYENNHANSEQRGGLGVVDDDFIVENNACFNNEYKDIYDTTGILDYNATSDDTGDDEGVHGIANLTTTDQFKNPTTNWNNTDLRIKAGADLINAGHDPLSGIYTDYPEINYPITSRITPISGTWDIGADEFVLIPVIIHHLRQQGIV